MTNLQLAEKLSELAKEAVKIDQKAMQAYNDLDDLTDELEAVIEDELVYKLFRGKILSIQHILEEI